VIASLLKSDRKLDRRNPMPEALADDYARFGMELWVSLKSTDRRNEIRERRLRALIEARNAVSHADAGGLARLKKDGYPLDLRTGRIWLSSLKGLARNMDAVVADQIVRVVGGPRPW
jgi:hypothetical protein